MAQGQLDALKSDSPEEWVWFVYVNLRFALRHVFPILEDVKLMDARDSFLTRIVYCISLVEVKK